MDTETSKQNSVLSKAVARSVQAPVEYWDELLIFIHGITPEPIPGPAETSYNKLLQLINEALPPAKKFEESKVIPISWGAGKNLVQNSLFETPYADQYVAEVERRIAQKVKPTLDEYNKLDPALIFPSRAVRFATQLFKVRDTLLYGIPDLFFYISADGEQVIRNRVFKTVSDTVQELHGVTQRGISLTLIGHSAGSVIAHDFLYHLSGKSDEQVARDESNPNKQPAAAEILKLRQMKQSGKLRLRRFYTLGSPITALMIRSNSLIEKIMRGGTDSLIDPKDLGLGEDLTLPGPRWINFWDIDDYASFPVEPFYLHGGNVVKDEYIDHNWGPGSDLFPATHTMYWESESIAKRIAENF